MSIKWRPVVGFEGAYLVSNYGEVMSVPRTASDGKSIRGRVLRQRTDSRGYKHVGLSANGVASTFKVHAIVLEAFVGMRPVGMHARHLDGDPANNAVDNLAWGTASENAADTVRHGRHPNARKQQCPRGHALTGSNLVAGQLRRGKRSCRACALEGRSAAKSGRAFDIERANDRYAQFVG